MSFSDIPSSQETVEDSALPDLPAEGATITLIPESAEARFAFHECTEYYLK